MRIFKYICIFLSGMTLAVVVYGAGNYYIKSQEAKEGEEKRKALYGQILSAASVAPLQFNIDYSKPVAKGSPLVFGGSHSPPLDQQDAWDKIADIGVTSIRKDFFPENALPRNITLEDYKQNKNNIQDPVNWNWNEIDKINDIYRNAKQRNMKVIGIASYAPAWLTYSNSFYGVPKDWDVYKDIIKKIYKIYRDNLDYVEIWNEPDHKFFLDTKNSGLTKAEAYKNIYKYASEAIRETDNEINDGKKVFIGGPAESNPRVSDLLSPIVTSPDVKIKPEFLTYHTYDSFTESLEKYSRIRNLYLPSDTPIFVTEWNMHSIFFDTTDYKKGDKALTYTADKIVDYLKYGISGANYFSLVPVNINNNGSNESTMGFYRWVNDSTVFLPQAKTWRLLSLQMGLGKGGSSLYESDTNTADLNSVGFINADNFAGFVMVNNSKKNYTISASLKNTNLAEFAEVQVYNASKTDDAENPVYAGLIKSQDGNFRISLVIPANSVVGVRMKEKRDWYDFFNKPFQKMGQ